MKPGSYSTQKLAAEAAAMEARLTALKLELQKDKAKREAAAAASAQLPGKCSIWGNGQQGPLRWAPPAAGSGNKAADTTAATAGASPAAASRSLSARSNSSSSRTQPIHAGLAGPARSPSAVKPPPACTPATSSFRSSPSRQHSSKAPSASSTRPTSTSSTTSTGSLDTRNNDTSTKSAAAKPCWLQQLKQEQQEASSPAQLMPAQQQAAGGFKAAAEQHQHMHGAAEEDSCAGLQGPSLLHGTYDETEAAGSFQEALRQWREASSAGSSAGHSSSCAGADSAAGSSAAGTALSLLFGTYDEKEAASSFQEALRQWRQAGPAGASASSSNAEVPRKPVRQHTSSTSTAPSTAPEQVPTTRTINTSVAVFLQKLTVRSSPSADHSTSSSPATQAASLSPPAASGAVGSVTAAACTSGVVARAQYSPGELAAAGLASVSDAAEATAAADCVDCGEECSTDTGSTVDQAEPFDSWLQQAEAAAATLVSSGHHSGASYASNVHLVGGGNSRGSSTESGQTGSGQYCQQLDSLLDRMEQLELELKERTQPVQVRVHVA